MALQSFAHDLNFHSRWRDQIHAIFLNISSLLSNKYPELGIQGIVVLKLCYLYSWSIKREIFLQRKAKKKVILVCDFVIFIHMNYLSYIIATNCDSVMWFGCYLQWNRFTFNGFSTRTWVVKISSQTHLIIVPDNCSTCLIRKIRY